MGLRDRLKKTSGDSSSSNAQPEFRLIVRSDTASRDAPLSAPTAPSSPSRGWSARRSIDQMMVRLHLDVNNNKNDDNENDNDNDNQQRRSRSASAPSSRGPTTPTTMLSPTSPATRQRRRLSQRLMQHLGLPSSPTGPDRGSEEFPTGRSSDEESEFWERRATMLAGAHDEEQQPQPQPQQTQQLQQLQPRRPSQPSQQVEAGASSPSSPLSTRQTDAAIQEAIRLHEAGSLEQSTSKFGQLADPSGANNPLSQVLYGLALRHGWGCRPDPEAAVRFLSAAASSAAAVEQAALQAGLMRGGAAKGELVLAIFELANCFRNGWGVQRDAVAAKQYYETAANLGDTGKLQTRAPFLSPPNVPQPGATSKASAARKTSLLPRATIGWLKRLVARRWVTRGALS
ncbi:hypothetical protein XA68_11319 [Ophiocordyceps unilateralis]|uniref:Uncharacterized protein n=1 Tax=Ophiocordyceps unilateralis TaxID=268505 RepID=A0A2A9PH31_OPHUN|nr:hypothetical protein XA68_11319 [Ophiocordyceps unilateralis]